MKLTFTPRLSSQKEFYASVDSETIFTFKWSQPGENNSIIAYTKSQMEVSKSILISSAVLSGMGWINSICAIAIRNIVGI